ncbi:MAG: GNAT family N-acetyltransferase [Vulcanimicrobiaceae bacterium]
MLDHLSLGVSSLQRSMAFYDAVLSPLGYARVWSGDDAAGYGPPGEADGFAIKRESGRALTSPRRLHVAFCAVSRDAVRCFHAAALQHGDADDGAPGIHAEYGPGYFAAFVIDPDGYRIEAVLHEPQTMLVEVTDEDFAWMLRGGEHAGGLRLPSEGIEVDIASHVQALVGRLREVGCNENWMIVSGGECVGLCGFKNPPAEGCVEIGYNVWPSRQRLGHATRAVAAMLDHAKTVGDLTGVTAETSAENIPSQRVLDSNGFERTSTRHDDDGDLILWRITLRA